MLQAAERESCIARIRQLPAAVEDVVRGLNDGQLDTPYREAGWTPRQVVHHLADSHMNAYIRSRLILTESHPTLRPYQQEDWARLPDAQRAPLAASLELLRGLHWRWAALFTQLPEPAWARTGFHPDNGDMTLADILVYYSRHGDNHVGQIHGLRKARGW